MTDNNKVAVKPKVMFPRVTDETIREMQTVIDLRGGIDAQRQGRIFSKQRVDMFVAEQPELVALAHDIAEVAGEDATVFALVATGMSIAYDGLKRQMEKGE